MEDSPSFSLGLTQLDTNSVVGFVPEIFDYEEPNFVENRSKFRNDPNKMKEIRKAAPEKSKKAVEKSSRLSKKDDSGRLSLPKVVGIKVKYEKFRVGMFSKFVYNNIRPTHEEVQTLDLQMIEGFQLKEAESEFPSEIVADCFDKRPVIDVQSQVDLDIQGFEEFRTVPPTKILKKDVEGCSEDNDTASLDAFVKSVVNHNSDNTNVGISTIVHVHNDHMDVEGVSVNIGPSTLECLVAAVENQKLDNDNVGTSNMQIDYSSTLSESAQFELDAILKVIAAPVDDVPTEVVPPAGSVVNQHDISDSQLPLDFSDLVVAAHQAAKTPAKVAKRIRMRSRVFKSPYTTEYASGCKAIEDQIEEQKQQFVFDGFLISDTMPSSKKSKLRSDQDYKFTTTNCFFKNYIDKRYSRYYEDDTDTVLTPQQDYVESVRVALIEETITYIIKRYCMPSDLPWHQVDEVYVPINCNENFHWVLAVIALEDRRIRVYDSLSRRRNTESITEIQKLAKMLPTYLSDNKFYDEISRTDWPNLETYRDKITYNNNNNNNNKPSVFPPSGNTEEMNVPSDDFEAKYHRMCYATLFRKYGIQKAKKGYVSENDDPPRPKSRIIQIPDDNAIVCIE
ncbi:hypothetical protein CQW23_05300 [Capsicum baccatum]|uniref:Ubiquitin-like protease family profile domain-containing protein n=1 Tax=Capsicum baccatum TaxID=33114 RepID=A0A2G2XH44_CAPBA|nr:hypothetical protein CQW23_05300 [Capsicum baccatum]